MLDKQQFAKASIRCGFLIVLISCFGRAEAIEKDRFERLADDLVLGQSSVQAFAQDQDGYLWLGTQAGLHKFDGYRFESFQPVADNPASLSNRFVTNMMVAKSGHIWVGTYDGLNRIEPRSRQITQIRLRQSGNENSALVISSESLVEDIDGDVFAAGDGIVVRWDQETETLLPVRVEGPEKPGPRTALRLDRAGRLWLAGTSGLWRYDRESGAFTPVLGSRRTGFNSRLGENFLQIGPGNGVTYVNANGAFIIDPDEPEPIKHLLPTRHGFESDRIDAVAMDSGANIWLRLADEIVRIPATSPQNWETFPQVSFFGPSANSNVSRLQLAETQNGSIWLAGRFGLLRYDPSRSQLTSFRHDPNNPRSVPHTLGEIGYRIFLDDFGVLWIGANLGGLTRLTPQSDRFVHVRDTSDSLISRNIVRAIAEQQTLDENLIWVANQNAGLTVWRRRGRSEHDIFHHYPPSFQDGPKIGDIRSIAVHPEDGSIWLGGSHALGRAENAGAPIRLFELEPPAPSLAPGLRSIHFLDSSTLVACSTFAVWLIDLTENGGTKVRRRFDMPAGIMLFDLLPLNDGRILLAGLGGLIELDLEDGTTINHFPAGQPGMLPANSIFHLAGDANGEIWAGTRGAGLLRIGFDHASGPAFEFFGPEKGLPDDTVYGVLTDPYGSLWLSSNRGIIRLNPDQSRLRYYTPGDNLQAWEFNHTVAHVGTSGRYYFGGINGWNVFRPGTVRDLLQPPRVHLQSVAINEEKIEFADGTGPLDLAHDQNHVVIEYVGLQFAAPDRTRYAFRMRGLDDKWMDAGAGRQARYASLAPGNYAFEVKAANLDGIWSSSKQLIQLEVASPPWFTPMAWLLYAAVSVLLVLALLAGQKRKRQNLLELVDRRTEQLKQNKEIVDRQASELEQALEAQTQLFANVSHEFRTPLTLIRAAIEKLELAPDPDAAKLGRKYVDRLLRMVEQLLDLSRLRLAPTTEPTPCWRLDSVVSQTIDAFKPAAEHQLINVENYVDGVWHTQCPQNLVEKILLNLISNAIKFTPPGGRIKISLQPSGENAVICVEDTGSGIAESDQRLIFNRFYRTNAADTNHVSGAGIGLALVAEATRACGGSLDVASQPGHGTCIWVSLPARRPKPGEMIRPASVKFDEHQLDLVAMQSDRDALDNPDPTAISSLSTEVQGTVLVVEDNADLREYLAKSLAPMWHVEQAVDGVRGFTLAREISPDLIISDLMMPNLDGFEMLARLREDIETCHIPVLFLTARNDNETRVKAFTLSADAFLAKPFDLDELKARLKQMMAQRDRIRTHLLKGINRSAGSPQPAGHGLASASEEPADLALQDRRLLEKLGEWLEANYSNPDLDTQAIADAVHLTPRTLQRKLKSLIGRTPAAYLREYRMESARKLLQSSDSSVTAIAHACGFSSSQYFSRAFRDDNGAPPEKWRHTNKPKET